MEDQNKKFNELERELAEHLQPEEIDEEERDRRVKAKLSPKYEIRVQAVHDPVREETLEYRKLAKEIDQRYDKFVSREETPGEEK